MCVCVFDIDTQAVQHMVYGLFAFRQRDDCAHTNQLGASVVRRVI